MGRTSWLLLLAPSLVLTAVSGSALAAYATGEYWPLPGDKYRYSLTVWNVPADDSFYIDYIIVGLPLDSDDLSLPPGWRIFNRTGVWRVMDPEDLDSMIAPGEVLGRFAYTSSLLDLEHQSFFLHGYHPLDPHQFRWWEGDILWELAPEAGATPLAALALLSAAGIRARRKRRR
jgi:uncharacterized protein (TIGR03382 family)